MVPRVTRKRRGAAGDPSFGCFVVSPSDGFSLVEMTTSVAVMLVVMTAAWLLLTTSNDNLNRIGYGGQASDINRAALASFERDLGHAMLPSSRTSPVFEAGARACTFMADIDNPGDGFPELVTWSADDVNHRLVRTVERPPTPVSAHDVMAIGDLRGGAVTSSTVLTGLSPATVPGTPMFTYKVSATDPFADLVSQPARVGLVSFRLANGLPDETQNVVDRTGSFRIIALVINGY